VVWKFWFLNLEKSGISRILDQTKVVNTKIPLPFSFELNGFGISDVSCEHGSNDADEGSDYNQTAYNQIETAYNQTA